jgi:hypothetical protein
MKKDYTHISVILDRSGSMETIRDDTIGGFNTFLESQKSESGTATLTLVQFDTQDPYQVIYKFKPIQEIPMLERKTYVPRASTPLLDALGRGINDVEHCINEIQEEDRPAKVIIVIVTDGQENSSKEFLKDNIEKMIKDKMEKYSWQFVFLSADLASIDDAMRVGFHANSSLMYEKSSKGSRHAWSSLSLRTSEYRSAQKKKIGFEQEDRKHPDDPNKSKD